MGIDVDLVVANDRLRYVEGKDFVTVLKQMMPAAPVVLLSEEVPQQTCRARLRKRDEARIAAVSEIISK